MGGPPYDIMANPLGAVRLTFDKAVGSGTHPSALDGKDWGALDVFRQTLFHESALSSVPVLNPSTVTRIPPNSLVRYRGMIQDMLGNEFYVGAYRERSSWRTNKFSDPVSDLPIASSPDFCIWERRLLYCVPIPGRSSWTEASCEGVVKQITEGCQNKEKRRRTEEEDSQLMEMTDDDDAHNDSPATKKMREGHSYPMDSNIEGTSCSSTLEDMDNNCLPCLVKIYDSPESELKLNDVFEFIGVLTFDSVPTEANGDSSDGLNDFSDDLFVDLPPNKVPRLHCLLHRKLTVDDFLQGTLVLEPKPHLMKEFRESLLRHLTVIVGNDGVAAHFMLLHLLSKVHARIDDIAVGKLSLNLTSLNKQSASTFGTQLRHALENLLPVTRYVPLSLDYLNSAELAPKKDYQSNRLLPGVLQLPEGSHLTIDETLLKAGNLSSKGSQNARLLKNLMEFQKVEYDFQYYNVEMVVDVQLLILSEGKSNIMPADIIIPFQPSSVDVPQVVGGEALEAWRWYLANVRLLPHFIESEMQKVVEDDFVEARQADESISSQDFSRWLTMGRLMASSFGETSLKLEHWQMVRELERLRRERLC